ncbi:MAG: Ig-like domain-containing protein [Gemmatimonadetes bacterium]|nr:Ig-like domain-containing protein [Candidatus Palauibacter rhopaloidicola]
MGETETLDVSQYFSDPDGDALSYSAASSDTTSATATASGNAVTVRAVAPGTATITVTATDPDAASAAQSFNVTVPNRAPERTDTIPNQELAVGGSTVFDLEGYFRDPDGDTLSYASETSNEAVATASVSGSTLTVRASAKGHTTIFVTAADPRGLTVADSFNVTVPNQAPVVTATIPAQGLTVGEVREWTGSEHFADPDGDALTYAAGTTDASIVLAIVSGGDFGIVAVAPGTAMVTVTVTDGDGLSASQAFRVTVQARGAVIISRVEPTVLLEGAPATIRGSGFARVAGNNIVLVGGLRATVTAASSTSLSITVPYADCLPPRQAVLRVTAFGSSDTHTVGVTPLSRDDIDLPPGYYKVSHAGNGCLHLPGGATGDDYLIGVLSTSEDPSSLTPVTMTSIPGDPTVAAARGQAVAAAGLAPAAYEVADLPVGVFSPPPAPAATGLRLAPDGQSPNPQRDWERHNEIMASSDEMLSRLGPLPPQAGSRQARTVVTGDTMTLFAGGNDFRCRSRRQVRAVVRLVGDRTVWLDDIENPSGTFTDSELAALDAFYAGQVKNVHDRYFGRLSDVDGNGRILILMTKEVNREDRDATFIGGWVWSPDLYPRSMCGTSNHGEVFFGRVPDPGGVVGQAWTRQQTFEYYPSLLAHEIAHIVQANAQVFGGARLTRWELEGGATLSEELVAYRLFGHGSGMNLGYAEYVAGSTWYHWWLRDLLRFFGYNSDAGPAGRVEGAPEECSWMGRPEDGNDGPCKGSFRAVYGVPSVVLRYAMDRWGGEYSGGESALMRWLTQSPSLGLAALEEVSSWRRERILADFYMGLWLDGRPGPDGGSWNWFSTWNIHGIIGGLRNVQFRPQPWVSSAARFEGRWNVRAGSTFYLQWTPIGSRGPTSLRVTLPNGAPVPGHVSVWALRIR